MLIESVPLMQAIVPVLPETGLLLLLMLVLMHGVFSPRESRRSVCVITGVGFFTLLVVHLSVGFSFVGDPDFSGSGLGDIVRVDAFAVMFRAMILLAAALTCLMSGESRAINRRVEFYVALIVATLGMCLMVAANDLILVYVALETASVSLYIMAGFQRDSERSAEAGLKYYLFGAVTSAILLYGLSLIFGFTGETNFSRLGPALSALASGGSEGVFALVVALLLVLTGLGFKVAVVPFHFWTPDVYEGSPTPAVAFISTASKAASFGLLVRFFSIVWPAEMIPYWAGLLAALAGITMTLGNMLALVQKNIKRMLGYSSIAQAGYALIGVVALSDTELGAASVAFYMAMYVLTNLAAFAVVSAVEWKTGSVEIAGYAGLSRRSFPLAVVMALAMLSLGGVPPAAGFFGKFFLFSAAVDSGYTWLAIIGVVNAIIALFYYLTIIKVMFVGEAEDESRYTIRPRLAAVLWVTGIGILLMGTLASPWWNWAVEASQQLTVLLP